MSEYKLTFEGNTLTSIGEEKDLVIPRHITEISDLCRAGFMFHEHLESIKVEEGNPVFHSAGNCLIHTENKELVLGCKNSVIPEDGSVERIGHLAFAGIGTTASSEPDGSFTTIKIPSTVIYIGSSAFASSGIETIQLPESLLAIDSFAFAETELRSLYIPKSVEILGHAILRNTGVGKIEVSPENSNYYSENNCIIEREGEMLVACSPYTIIPDGVERIGELVLSFVHHKTLITVPQSVKEIKEFQNFEMPAAIEFPVILRVKEHSYAHKFAVRKELEFEVY